MELNRLQLAAMAKVGNLMAMADGKFEHEEALVIAAGFADFGIDGDEFQLILGLAESMKPEAMLSILANMNIEQKKFVCGFLSTIMTSDGDIDESELKLWQLTSTLADFPTMTINEASEYWRSH